MLKKLVTAVAWYNGIGKMSLNPPPLCTVGKHFPDHSLSRQN